MGTSIFGNPHLVKVAQSGAVSARSCPCPSAPGGTLPGEEQDGGFLGQGHDQCSTSHASSSGIFSFLRIGRSSSRRSSGPKHEAPNDGETPDVTILKGGVRLRPNQARTRKNHRNPFFPPIFEEDCGVRPRASAWKGRGKATASGLTHSLGGLVFLFQGGSGSSLTCILVDLYPLRVQGGLGGSLIRMLLWMLILGHLAAAICSTMLCCSVYQG